MLHYKGEGNLKLQLSEQHIYLTKVLKLSRCAPQFPPLQVHSLKAKTLAPLISKLITNFPTSVADFPSESVHMCRTVCAFNSV